jgi:toxin-antitoxin system PIN domain toxin
VEPVALVDTSVWLALLLDKHRFHTAARDWLGETGTSGQMAFCRATQQSLLRLLTTAAVLSPYGNAPLTNAQAWASYRALRMDARIGFADEPPHIEMRWQQLTNQRAASPKLWMDGYLAAFAIAGHYRLVTADAAFTRHAGLDLVVLRSA